MRHGRDSALAGSRGWQRPAPTAGCIWCRSRSRCMATSWRRRSTTSPSRHRICGGCAPSVCLLADHYAEDWSRLWWARADGLARIVTDPAECAAPLAWLAAKYPQYQAQPPPARVIRGTRLTGTTWPHRLTGTTWPPPDRHHLAAPPDRHHLAAPPDRHHLAAPPDRHHLAAPPDRHHLAAPPDRHHLAAACAPPTAPLAAARHETRPTCPLSPARTAAEHSRKVRRPGAGAAALPPGERQAPMPPARRALPMDRWAACRGPSWPGWRARRSSGSTAGTAAPSAG